MTDTATRVAQILRHADRVYREATTTTLQQKIDDTLGPNPCQAAQFTNRDTGETTNRTCDRKRCPDCGPRKQLTIHLQLQAGFDDIAYVGRTMSRQDIDRALETDKKKRQRGLAADLTYQIVGDDSLGYVIVSNRQLVPEQRRMDLREWIARILDLYHRAGQRIRRSRSLGRLSLIPVRRRRESGTGPSSWSYVNRWILDRTIREWFIDQQNQEIYSHVQLARSLGFSADAIRPPSDVSDPLAGRPVPF